MLDVRLVKRLGTTQIDVSFRSAGHVTALFGRSGAGKTSILSMIAGLIKPDEGHVVCGGDVLFDAAAGIDVPPHKRRIGYVFQDGRLFPHFSVRQNLNFGRWMNRLRANAAMENQVVDLLDIGHLMKRRTGALSGGERQRVAIGRALLSEPRLLLLDEPLASLDEGLKAEILPYLLRLKRDMLMPMVYVSHVREEIEHLADSVISIDKGSVQTQAAPGSPLSAAASMPASAAISSLSEVSPETPTAPTSSPAVSRMSTPPGTGTSEPPMT